ncbi:MAG: tRNA-(ms[2]io[6]A)-hydroxylase [Planctomycetes bacterium]|nr:tRNA-(ms[2]io[6]A)-hydroxylase [Planctomycetota bacterium]
MLALAYDTPPTWTDAALADLPSLLLDHYFLEIKAACSARWLEAHHAEALALHLKDLRALAKEEEAHAKRVQGFLHASGDGARPQRENRYVLGLRRLIAADGHKLLDRLLIAALIEGRSCERFRLLAHAERGSALGGFYEDLYAAEARHYAFFLELAAEIAPSALAEARFRELARAEGELVAGLPHGPRIH